ncbi:hypothetical protein [Bartonella jaculi]|uniref:hypothetical protein n=1 Tax=Bartonella jaculi TaxID=686226 RepID=UPI0031E53D9B
MSLSSHTPTMHHSFLVSRVLLSPKASRTTLFGKENGVTYPPSEQTLALPKEAVVIVQPYTNNAPFIFG